MKAMGAAVLAVAMLAAGMASAEVKVLSAGAVQPGLERAAAAWKQAGGEAVAIQFNTVPELQKRLEAGYVADVVIASPPALAALAKAGKVGKVGKVGGEAPVALGRVGAGVAVRADAAGPAIATTEDLKRALLAADSIVYNTASSGLYLEKLFDRLGIGEAVKPKTTRYPDGAGVLEHVIHGKGNEIGFGAMTEIKSYEGKGLKLVGPLPADIQNATSYAAAVATNAPSADAAKAFVAYLASPEAKQIFVAAGIE